MNVESIMDMELMKSHMSKGSNMDMGSTMRMSCRRVNNELIDR